MSNHLAHRWPDRQPRPIVYPHTHTGKIRRVPHILPPLLLGLAVAAVLLLGGYFGVLHLTRSLLDTTDRTYPPSLTFPTAVPADWEPADLPWTQPDGAVSLTVQAQDTQALTSNQIYTQALPSVVCITADQGNGSASVGSGVVVTDSGYIVTNYHILEGGTQLTVSLLSDQRTYPAWVVGYDEELDLAVLKVEAEALIPARLGNSDQLAVGDPVYAIGNPMGYLHGTMTEGIISSPTRTVQVDGRDMDLLQTSAALNSGNSGGALINQYGQVVGITTAKISGIENDTVIEGLGLVIPIRDALPFLNQILQTGQSFRPSLGILCQAAQMDTMQGVYVVSITPGTPAETLLMEGDVILAANGVDTPTVYTLTRVLNDTGVGNTVELSVLREGAMQTVAVTLYDRME